LQLVVIYRVII